MLSFFRTNQIFNSVLLIFYILILWGAQYFVPNSWLAESNGIFAEWLLSHTGTGTIWSRIIALFLLLFNATFINYLVAEFRLDYDMNLFPGLFYILVSCCIPEFLHLSPILIANTFLLFALLNLLKTYKNSQPAVLIFNTGFWIAIASLFYFSFVIFLLMGLIGLSILRAFKIRERLMMICGFIVPYFLLGTIYFWLDQFGLFWSRQVTDNIKWMDYYGTLDATTYVKLGAFALLILWVIFNSGVYNFKKNIQIQKRISVLFWVLLFAGFTVFFQAKISLTHLQIITIPVGIFLGLTFSRLPSNVAESIHFILLILAVALQLKVLL